MIYRFRSCIALAAALVFGAVSVPAPAMAKKAPPSFKDQQNKRDRAAKDSFKEAKRQKKQKIAQKKKAPSSSKKKKGKKSKKKSVPPEQRTPPGAILE